MKISSIKVLIAGLAAMFVAAALICGILVVVNFEDETVRIFGVLLIIISAIPLPVIFVYVRGPLFFKKHTHRIVAHGTEQVGKIYGYKYHSKCKLFGKNMIVLDVLYFDDNDRLQKVYISTDQTDKGKFPKYSILPFKLYKNRARVYGKPFLPEIERSFTEKLNNYRQ